MTKKKLIVKFARVLREKYGLKFMDAIRTARVLFKAYVRLSDDEFIYCYDWTAYRNLSKLEEKEKILVTYWDSWGEIYTDDIRREIKRDFEEFITSVRK